MSRVLVSDLESAARAAGLKFRHCGGCHYQVIGGAKLVNFYDTAKGSKVYVDGERKGRFVSSVAQVIEAAGVKQQPKGDRHQKLLAELREEMMERVTVSLSRDVVSLGCDDREHAMRVFCLIEQIATDDGK